MQQQEEFDCNDEHDDNNLSSCSYATIEIIEHGKGSKNVRKGRPKTTKPFSPKLRINKRLSIKRTQILSSEELQMKSLELERKEMAAKLQQNRRRYQTLKTHKKSAEAGTTIVRSTKRLTVPTTPVSHLKTRLGSVKKPTIHNQIAETIGSATSRDNFPRKPTLCEPFQFATDKRLKKEPPARSDANIPAAELIQKFFKDPRSHHVPANAAKSVTLPCSPILKTKSRSKSMSKPRPLSHDEIIDQEMKEFEKHAFRAKPVNKRIFECMGEVGVPKVEAKTTTEPVEFHLNCDRRASQPRIRESIAASHSTEDFVEFKARPMPNFNSSSSDQQAPSSPRPATNVISVPTLTIPVSPKLSGGRRASSAPARRQRPSHKEVEKQKEEEQEKLNKFLHQPPPANPTAPVEFHLATSSRGQQHQAALQAKLEAELRAEQEARVVHAQPLKAAILERPASLPAAPVKGPTEPQPFQLRSEVLHAESQKTQQQLHRLQEEQMRKEAAFKAKPLPRTTFEEETLNKDEREPVKPLQVVLESDVRAQRRKAFDLAVSQKMQELQLMQIELSKQKERQDSETIREMRRKSVAEGGLCFKAAPVPSQDAYPLKMVTSAPTTASISPRLSSSRDKEPAKEKKVGAKKDERALKAVTNATPKAEPASKKLVPKGKLAMTQSEKVVKGDLLSSSSCDSKSSPRAIGKESARSSSSGNPRAPSSSRKRNMEFAHAIANF